MGVVRPIHAWTAAAAESERLLTWRWPLHEGGEKQVALEGTEWQEQGPVLDLAAEVISSGKSLRRSEDTITSAQKAVDLDLRELNAGRCSRGRSTLHTHHGKKR